MVHINKTTLSCYYAGHDPTEQDNRDRDKVQLRKKERRGTIDPEKLREAWEKYLQAQQEEFRKYFDEL